MTSSRVKQSSLILEDGTERLSPNIGNLTTNQFCITSWNSKNLINILFKCISLKTSIGLVAIYLQYAHFIPSDKH
jgi:hypothetical protein